MLNALLALRRHARWGLGALFNSEKFRKAGRKRQLATRLRRRRGCLLHCQMRRRKLRRLSGGALCTTLLGFDRRY